MDVKAFWKSKTFWLNVVAILVEVLRVYGDVESLPKLDPAVLALLNLGVRAVTKQGVALKS